MVAVHGRDAESFRQAVEKSFGQFLKGRPWLPLQAGLVGNENLMGLPMLRTLPPHLEKQPLTYGFLRKHCAVCDTHGMIDSLYIAMKSDSISWRALRHSPIFIEGLEDSWAYDALLDPDDTDT